MNITITLPASAEELARYTLPGDLETELLRPDPADGSTSVEVWSVTGQGEAVYLSRWSSGRGSLTAGSDSQWGDWTTDGRLLLDDAEGAWADEDGTVHAEDEEPEERPEAPTCWVRIDPEAGDRGTILASARKREGLDAAHRREIEAECSWPCDNAEDVEIPWEHTELPDGQDVTALERAVARGRR